jgi:hypothetical protein
LAIITLDRLWSITDYNAGATHAIAAEIWKERRGFGLAKTRGEASRHIGSYFVLFFAAVVLTWIWNDRGWIDEHVNLEIMGRWLSGTAFVHLATAGRLGDASMLSAAYLSIVNIGNIQSF